jgi:hypothetical protein
MLESAPRLWLKKYNIKKKVIHALLCGSGLRLRLEPTLPNSTRMQSIFLLFSSAQKREPGPGLWSITNNMDVLDDNMSKKFKTKSNLSEIGKRGRK